MVTRGWGGCNVYLHGIKCWYSWLGRLKRVPTAQPTFYAQAEIRKYKRGVRGGLSYTGV